MFIVYSNAVFKKDLSIGKVQISGNDNPPMAEVKNSLRLMESIVNAQRHSYKSNNLHN